MRRLVLTGITPVLLAVLAACGGSSPTRTSFDTRDHPHHLIGTGTQVTPASPHDATGGQAHVTILYPLPGSTGRDALCPPLSRVRPMSPTA